MENEREKLADLLSGGSGGEETSSDSPTYSGEGSNEVDSADKFRGAGYSSANAIEFLDKLNLILTVVAMAGSVLLLLWALGEGKGWAVVASFLCAALTVVYWATTKLALGLAQDIRAIRIALNSSE